jgi:glycosyltransferase involved in cell wall biosynthesis
MRVLRVYPMANDARFRQRDHALRRHGIEVGIVLPDAYGSDRSTSPVEPDIPHWRSKLFNRNSIPLHLWNPRALRRAMREFAPHLVRVHEDPYFPGAAQAVAAAGPRPVVMFAAQNIPKSLPAPVRALRSWVLRRVDGAYPCCTEAGEILRLWGFRGAMSVIPYGVDDALFNVRPRGERIGFVGRLVPEKGLRDLLELGSRLLVVGDGPLAGELQAAGAEVVSARSSEELARQLERMAVLAVPSRTTPTSKEQFGRMAAEAMAAGVPVVAYDSGALPEVIGDTGVIVPEGDRTALVAAIHRVLADPRDLAMRARKRASAIYRWDAVAGRMVELYERCVWQPQT